MAEKDLSKPLDKFEWVVDLLYDGRRLDKFVRYKANWRSRSTVQKVIRSGEVSVNGRPGKPNTVLKKGDVVTVKLNIPEVDLATIKLDIIYEDDYFLVLNKQPGILVHPAGKKLFGTLINALHARYKQEEYVQPMLCHRLDEFTSGALLVAKNGDVKRYFQREFEAGRIDKSYIALVEGDIERDSGRIELKIGPSKEKKLDNRFRMAVVEQGGQDSVTEFEVEERFGDFTLVRLKLHTGRTHQIRLHMKHIGHPVVCDEVYSGRGTVARADVGLQGDEAVLERQALHSAMLTFVHPVTEERLTVEADLAEDMSNMLTLLRGRPANEKKQTE